MTLQEYFSLLGWNESDEVGFGGLYHDKMIRIHEPLKLFPLHEEAEKDVHFYYACSTFDPNKTRCLEANTVTIKEIVIDIDYGKEGHKKYQFEDEETATKYAEQYLPIPTVLVHTGNGLQLHYRLDVPPERQDFKAVLSAMNKFFKIDCCVNADHLFRLPLTWNAKNKANPKKVRILSHTDIGYSIETFRQLLPAELDVFATIETPTYQAKRTMKRIVREEKNTGLDRSALAFRIIARTLAEYPTLSTTTIAAIIKNEKNIFDHYQNERALRQDIGRIRLKTKAQVITGVLPAEKLRIPDDYDLSHIETMRQAFDQVAFSSREEKFDLTLAILDTLHSNRKNGILSVPCSSGKTYSSIIYVAHLAAHGKRCWLVSEKIQDCKRNAATLSKMGINAVAFHGQDATICKYPLIRVKQENLCSQCASPCGAELKYLHQYRFDCPTAQVVCCTHQNYKAALAADALPEDLELIIIDEAPDLLTRYTLTPEARKIVRNMLDGNIELAREFSAELHVIDQKLMDKGTHLINTLDIMTYKDDIIRSAFSRYNKHLITDKDLETVLAFINFFSRGVIYGIESAENHSFMTGSVDLQTNIQTIILDGSARTNCTRWAGFKIYECDQLTVSYPKTTVYCLKGNPTLRRLETPETFSQLQDQAVKIIHTGEEVLIFSNKDLTAKKKIQENLDKLRTELRAKGCTFKELHRGQHIGSNEGRSCSSTVVTMSLFSTVEDYALRASVFSQRGIAPEDIWHVDKSGIKHPKIAKNGSFVHTGMTDQYIRSLERDIYQAILRGCIRDNPQAEYAVVCLISNNQVLATLQEDLPGATIKLLGDEVIQFYLEGDTVTEIVTKTGLAKKSVIETIEAFDALLK